MKKVLKIIVLASILSSTYAAESEVRCNVLPDFDAPNSYSVIAGDDVLSFGLDFDFAMRLACLMQKSGECFFTEECVDI